VTLFTTALRHPRTSGVQLGDEVVTAGNLDLLLLRLVEGAVQQVGERM
jgi:hypothetical protein